jgi:chromosome segregation ATPase
MRRLPNLIAFLAISSLLLLAGCVDETADLKQKIAELEKKVQQQEKDLREFSGKFSPPKDFSADIQRIEDLQERVSQAMKTKVDPVNAKLEEFRDWAQDAQKERDSVGKKIQTLEQSNTELQKRLEAEIRQAAKFQKESIPLKKALADENKRVDELTKSLAEIRKEVLENNTKLVNAVKKTLPKVRDAAVAELKDRFTPLEKGIADLKVELENDRKALEAVKKTAAPAPAESGKDVQALLKKVKELEEVTAQQKANLLEIGSKVHELEVELKRDSTSGTVPRWGSSRR